MLCGIFGRGRAMGVPSHNKEQRYTFLIGMNASTRVANGKSGHGRNIR